MPERAPRILFFDNPTTRVDVIPWLQSLKADVEIAESVDQTLELLGKSREDRRPFDLVWTRMWIGKNDRAGVPVIEAALQVEEGSQKPRVLVTTRHPKLYSTEQLKYPEIEIVDINELNFAKVSEIVAEITPQP